jgi:hypothetical protein
MKRTFDIAMGSSAAQQISAGMTTTKDPVYYATNMVNISNEDTNVDHGISALFSQTRILPIVGKTSRAEVAIESADIQTKALPIFQPQVKLGNDPDELIYEVGISAQWRGSVLALPPDSSSIDPLIFDAGYEIEADTSPAFQSATIPDTLSNMGTQLQTFMNNPNAIGVLMDAYGLNKAVTLLPQDLFSWNTPPLQTLPYPTDSGGRFLWGDSNIPPWKNIAWVYSDSRVITINFSVDSPAVVYIQNKSATQITLNIQTSSGPQNYYIEPGEFKQVNVTFVSIQLVPVPTNWYSGETAINTTLNNLFNYWGGTFQGLNSVSGATTSEFASTCLTPICVGSVSQKISGCGMFESNIEYPTSMVVPVQSTDGFSVGDRVRFFGLTDVANPNVIVPTVYGTVLDVISYNLLQNPSNQLSPALIVDYYPSFQIVSTTSNTTTLQLTLQGTYDITPDVIYPFQSIVVSGTSATVNMNGVYIIQSIVSGLDVNGQFVVSVTNPAYSTVTPGVVTGGTGKLQINSLFTGGYVINPKVKDGGHIEFLTNEQSFRPRSMTLDNNIILNSNDLVLTTSFTSVVPANGPAGDLMNTGWFKGMNVGVSGVASVTENFSLANTVVKITCSSAHPVTALNISLYQQVATQVNGYYRISQRVPRVGSPQIIDFHLTPLNSSISLRNDLVFNEIDASRLSPITFTMELAPNFYTFDTRADIVIDNRLNNSVNELSFLRSLGYKPTTDLSLQTPTPMPTLLLPSTTWDRAYTVDWSFSSYQNIKWTPQNSTSRRPNPPVDKQDFGTDTNSSTYYNVYEINKFITGCVNPSIKNLFTDYTDVNPPNVFETKSLNTQLSKAYEAYTEAMTVLTPTSTQYVWSSTNQYLYGQWVVDTLAEGGNVFLSLIDQQQGATGPGGSGSYAWMLLGPVPCFTTTQQLGALAFDNAVTTSTTTLSTFSEVNVIAEPFYNSTPQVFYYTNSSPLMATTLFNPTPSFKTTAPKFLYDEKTLLLNWTLDNYGFSVNQTPYNGQTNANVANLSYQRLSWGNKTSDEFMTFESNSPFKFLFDNFPCECISYQDSLVNLRTLASGLLGRNNTYQLVNYWIWDSTSTLPVTSRYFTLFQSAESFSSCMSPVESIVIVSENIPVAEQLTSPVYYLFDSSSTQAKGTDATALTNKIIGEIFLPYVPFQSARTVVKYEPFEMKFYSLLDTKSFKQLDYSLYYRHRITQELVPLIITNYGSVNIKFVFRPTST